MAKRNKSSSLNSTDGTSRHKKRRSDERDNDDHDNGAADIDMEELASRFDSNLETQDFDREKALKGELGHIQSIHLFDFMCHENFALEFGPRINFIQGANGSGKSAILNAILLALGGRATTTTRGVDLTSFIRTNQKRAKVIIKLCNYIEGYDDLERYKPETYGKSIIIERTISASGVSNYKIRDEHEKTISTKKEEVDNIVKHFQILIDNPIAVLTQEVSKNFLNAQNPSQKFKFFVKATQLENIKNEYHNAKAIFDDLSTKFREKKEVVRMKEKEKESWTQKLEIIGIVNDSVNKSEALTKEMLFAELKITEKDFEEAKAALQAEEVRFGRNQEEFERVTQHIETLKKERDELKTKLAAMASGQNNSIVFQLREQLSAARTNLKESEMKAIKLSKDMNLQTEELRQLELRIRKMEERNQINYQSLIEELEAKMESDREKLEQHVTSQQALQEDMQGCVDKARQCKQELDHFGERIKALYIQLSEAKRATKNRIERYGQKFGNLMQMMEQNTGKFSKQPYGPIGEYLDIQDENAIQAVEACLGSLLYAFVVDNSQDQKVLVSMFDCVFGAEARHPEVIVRSYKDQQHDVSRATVRHQRYRTMLQIIKPKNVNVANALIDHINVESVLFVPDYDEAQSLLIDKAKVPRNCTLAFTKAGDQMYPQTDNSDYKCYARTGNQRPRVLVKDMQQVIDALNADIQHHKDAKDGLDHQFRQANMHKEDKTRAFAQCEQTIRTLKMSLQDCRAKIASFARQNNRDVEADVLKEERDKVIAELEQLKQQQQLVNELKLEHTLAVNKASEALEEANLAVEQAHQQRGPFNEKIVTLTRQIAENEKVAAKFEPEKDRHARESMVLQSKLDQLLDKLKSEQHIALESNQGRFIDTNRAPQDIHKEMDYVKHILRTNQNFLSADEQAKVRESFLTCTAEVDRLHAGLDGLEEHIERLSRGLSSRLTAFVQLRYYTATITNFVFEQVLAQKGFSGEIKVVYEDGQPLTDGSAAAGGGGGAGGEAKTKGKTLELIIRPSDERQFSNSQAGASSSWSRIAYSSTKSLSGGERSFSTVAFIIALWEMCPSPFRCLDEVDVFMDCITRKLSLDTLIEFGATRSSKQYIFLTPLRLQNSHQVEFMKCFQMPEIANLTQND